MVSFRQLIREFIYTFCKSNVKVRDCIFKIDRNIKILIFYQSCLLSCKWNKKKWYIKNVIGYLLFPEHICSMDSHDFSLVSHFPHLRSLLPSFSDNFHDFQSFQVLSEIDFTSVSVILMKFKWNVLFLKIYFLFLFTLFFPLSLIWLFLCLFLKQCLKCPKYP